MFFLRAWTHIDSIRRASLAGDASSYTAGPSADVITNRSSGYCGPGVQNSQKFRSGTKTSKRYPGYSETEVTDLTGVPCTGMKVVKRSQKFRVRVSNPHGTHRTFGYCGTGVHNSQKFRIRVCRSHITRRTSGYCGMGVQSSPKFQAFFVGRPHKTNRSFDLWPRRTELTEVQLWHRGTELTEVQGNTLVNTPSKAQKNNKFTGQRNT